ncbi:MAG: hypothetical protein LBQ77_00185 [Treponema sp.]|nr:hypothetical protein [Treponema sp.]
MEQSTVIALYAFKKKFLRLRFSPQQARNGDRPPNHKGYLKYGDRPRLIHRITLWIFFHKILLHFKL